MNDTVNGWEEEMSECEKKVKGRRQEKGEKGIEREGKEQRRKN